MLGTEVYPLKKVIKKKNSLSSKASSKLRRQYSQTVMRAEKKKIEDMKGITLLHKIREFGENT